MSRPDEVPAGAEQFDAMDFLKGFSAPSKLLPGIMQRRFRLRCPKCSAVQPETFGTQRCACGVSMNVGINTLYVWEEHADVRV